MAGNCIICGKPLNNSHKKYCDKCRKTKEKEWNETSIRRLRDIYKSGHHVSDAITEDNSEYLRILRAQHNPSYKTIAKDYLDLIHGTVDTLRSEWVNTNKIKI